MHSRIHEFEKVEKYFEPKCGSYQSFIVVHKTTQKQFLLTKYNLRMLNMPPKVLQERLLFLCQNYKLFRCEAVFFQNHLPSLEILRPKILSKYITTFYVVEPLPLVTLADYATINSVTGEFLFKNLANVLNTLAALHSVRFPYLNLSPFSICVDDTLSLRPPPLNPFSSQKSLMPPPPKVYRSSFRSINEARFYRAPEWNSVDPFCPSDSWALGTILAEYLIFGGPVFGSLSYEDQMRRTQMILGPAPNFLKWVPPTITIPCDLPKIILELLDYDPNRRPWLCIHFCQRVLAYIHGNGLDQPTSDEKLGTRQDEIEENAYSGDYVRAQENMRKRAEQNKEEKRKQRFSDFQPEQQKQYSPQQSQQQPYAKQPFNQQRQQQSYNQQPYNQQQNQQQPYNQQQPFNQQQNQQQPYNQQLNQQQPYYGNNQPQQNKGNQQQYQRNKPNHNRRPSVSSESSSASENAATVTISSPVVNANQSPIPQVRPGSSPSYTTSYYTYTTTSTTDYSYQDGPSDIISQKQPAKSNSVMMDQHPVVFNQNPVSMDQKYSQTFIPVNSQATQSPNMPNGSASRSSSSTSTPQAPHLINNSSSSSSTSTPSITPMKHHKHAKQTQQQFPQQQIPQQQIPQQQNPQPQMPQKNMPPQHQQKHSKHHQPSSSSSTSTPTITQTSSSSKSSRSNKSADKTPVISDEHDASATIDTPSLTNSRKSENGSTKSSSSTTSSRIVESHYEEEESRTILTPSISNSSKHHYSDQLQPSVSSSSSTTSAQQSSTTTTPSAMSSRSKSKIEPTQSTELTQISSSSSESSAQSISISQSNTNGPSTFTELSTTHEQSTTNEQSTMNEQSSTTSQSSSVDQSTIDQSTTITDQPTISSQTKSSSRNKNSRLSPQETVSLHTSSSSSSVASTNTPVSKMSSSSTSKAQGFITSQTSNISSEEEEVSPSQVSSPEATPTRSSVTSPPPQSSSHSDISPSKTPSSSNNYSYPIYSNDSYAQQTSMNSSSSDEKLPKGKYTITHSSKTTKLTQNSTNTNYSDDDDDDDDDSSNPYSAPFSSLTDESPIVLKKRNNRYDKSKSSRTATTTTTTTTTTNTTSTDTNTTSNTGIESSQISTGSTSFNTSQEILDLRQRMRKLETSYKMSLDEDEVHIKISSDESDGSSSGMKVIQEITSLKERISALDNMVLNGCQGCEVALTVDQNLRNQEMILENFDDTSSSLK